MREQSVSFYSEGVRLAGILRSPDDGDTPRPAIVQGPGWLGLKDAKLYLPYHEAFTAAGFHVLIFDYRGFGDSEGDRGLLLPQMQLEDLINAVTYLTTRDDVDPDNLATFGSGACGRRLPRYRWLTARTGCAACAASTSGTSSWPGWKPIGGPA